jgi:hypothetical protein
MYAAGDVVNFLCPAATASALEQIFIGRKEKR